MGKRIVFWFLAGVLLLVAATVLAFRFSPWPSVMIIQYAFAQGEQASEAALEKHVPNNIVTHRNLAYGDGPDEIVDINYPQGTTDGLPTIVWVHGGAWITGSKDGIANYLKILAGHGYTSVGVEYATGFGVTYPEPVAQVNAALGHLLRNAGELNIDPGTIVLAGDSAGAQIAAQIALITTDPDYAARIGIAPELNTDQLAAILLLSGAYDTDGVDLDGDYGWFVRTVLWAYTGTRNFMNDERFRLASVTGHVTDAFPPAFISSGNGDPLAPQAVALAQRLDDLGVAVDSFFFPPDHDPPLPHEYQFNLDSAEGREALERMLSFIETIVEP